MTDAISQAGFNIENMHSKSKKDYAYTILDVSADVCDKAIEHIRSIDAVIRLWVI